MKAALAVLLLLGTAYGSSAASTEKTAKQTYDLYEDLRDFLELINQQQIVNIFLRYLDDSQVQQCLFYLFSPNFHSLYNGVVTEPDVQQFLEFFVSNGLPLEKWDAWLRNYFGIPHPNTLRVRRSAKIDLGGVAALLDEIWAWLPHASIELLARKKLETSPAYNQLFFGLRTPEIEQLMGQLRRNEVYQEMADALIGFGVQPARLLHIFLSAFGLNISV